jgi:excisionase family DNA binding protein
MRERKRHRTRTEPRGYLDPRLTYTKRGLIKAIGIGHESLHEAVASGIVKPVMVGGKNFYRGSEIEAWIWSQARTDTNTDHDHSRLSKSSTSTRYAGGESTKQLLTQEEAADFLNVKAHTLSIWRSTGRHELPYVKVGRAVRYRRSDLEKWLAKNTVEHT